MQEKHREDPPGEKTGPKDSLHDRGWFYTRLHPPPYYSPVDLWVGGDHGKVMKDWHRVSDGDNDYYCNSKDNEVIFEPSHWRKHPDVTYPPYDPLTVNDLPILSTNDVKEIVKTLQGLITNINPNPYMDYYNSAMEGCIDIIEEALKQKQSLHK